MKIYSVVTSRVLGYNLIGNIDDKCCFKVVELDKVHFRYILKMFVNKFFKIAIPMQVTTLGSAIRRIYFAVPFSFVIFFIWNDN